MFSMEHWSHNCMHSYYCQLRKQISEYNNIIWTFVLRTESVCTYMHVMCTPFTLKQQIYCVRFIYANYGNQAPVA